jgi:uncharacterized alkaline shock family protein YloU
MIRILTLILSFLLLFCLASICGFLVLWDANMIIVSGTAFSHLAVTLWGKTIIAAIGLIGLGCSLSLLTLLIGLEPGSSTHVILESETGSVGVSIDAIEEFVKRKGETVRGVRDLQVHAEIEEDGLVVRNRIVLELQRNIPEFIHEFQTIVNHELTVTLGIQNIKEVKVLIHKLFPRDASKEPKLLTGPQTVVLKQEQNDEEEHEPRRDEGVKIITPKDYREKDGSS